MLGLVGLGVSLGFFALLESLPLLYLGRFLDGIFAAAITPAAYALISDHAQSKEWRAYRFTLLNVAATAGFFVGPLLGGLVLRAGRELLRTRRRIPFCALPCRFRPCTPGCIDDLGLRD